MVIKDIQRSLGRIESKVDTLVTQGTDQETRIRDLEKTRSWVKGAWWAIVGLMAGIIKLLFSGNHTPNG